MRWLSIASCFVYILFFQGCAQKPIPETYRDVAQAKSDSRAGLGRIKNYRYSSQMLQNDIARGYKIIVVVDKAPGEMPAGQKLQLFVNGQLTAVASVSTGLEDLKYNHVLKKSVCVSTPTGRFAPRNLFTYYHSKLWNEYLPFLILFDGGFGIHEAPAGAQKDLGQRASAGCVRLSHEDAKNLFQLVKAEMNSTLIVIEDSAPNERACTSVVGAI